MEEKFLYGQGKVKLAPIVAGVTGKWEWVGDVSALSVGFEEEKAEHKESWSGKKAKVREFNIGNDMTMSATFHSYHADNLARFTRGTASSKVSGTVTSEDLGAVIAGDEIALEYPGVSNVVITDSATPAVTIAAEHYDVEDKWGNVLFKTLPAAPAPTPPLKAAYSYAAHSQVSFLSADQQDVALRYEGINLAEGGAPVIVELYKVSPGLLSELGLISDGNEVNGMEVEGAVLLDTRKPAAGALGQFGRIIQLS